MPQNAPNQSLQRAVQILYAVAGSDDGRTVPQIAMRLGIRPNTIGRYVRTLEQEKLLVRLESPIRFQIGPAIAELKHLDDTRHLLDVAGRVLVRMQVKLPQSNFSLVEPEGVETYSRLEVAASRPGYLQLHRARLHQPYEKASSMLFLAYAMPAERNGFFREHPFAQGGAQLWGTEQMLYAFWSDTVRKGYAEPTFPDNNLYRLAAPVWGPDGRMVAAVGAYMDVAERVVLRKKLRSMAVEAAKTITAKLISV